MGVTKDQVRHLGWLSRIELTDDELGQYTAHIEEIISFLDRLDEVPLAEEEPITIRKQVSGLREDVPREFGSETFGTAYRKDGYVKGPRMT